MSKRMIIVIIMMMLSFGIVSMYSTYAYDESSVTLNESIANHNLIYSISSDSNKQISLLPGDYKFVDVTLTNILTSPIRYGMYYYAVSPSVLPDGVKLSLAENSKDLLEDTIKPNKTKNISIKIENNSEYNVTLIIGALVGFEKGEIEDLETDKQILIK